MAGVAFDRPSIMGILNVTPDSFSDGGQFAGIEAALAQAARMTRADILDIGGESTRPGADYVEIEAETARTVPVIEALRARGETRPISIDTRKSQVARAAVAAGADLINDVSAMQFDRGMAQVMAEFGGPVCLMHAQGAPKTMQDDPRYGDVVFDVFDALAARVEQAEAAGIPRARILLDIGIGFGKTLSHNLDLLRSISLFHGLGCPLLLGVSRKRFIGEISGTEAVDARMPGTLAVTLAALGQGVQMHRVHDVNEIAQGVDLWRAVMMGEG
jgi:dihydropteroate synthase